jgi:hypothetical protein
MVKLLLHIKSKKSAVQKRAEGEDGSHEQFKTRQA